MIMKNNKGIIFGLVFAMGLVLGGFRQAAAQEKEEPKTFEAFYVKGMKTHEGVFPVYEQDKKVYLEIPARLLEREIFFSSRMLKGTDGNLQYGPSIGVAFFRMDAEGRLSLNSSVAVETSTDTTSAVYWVLEETRLPSVGELYPVVAYGRDGKSPIIEITSYLLTKTSWFATAGEGAVAAEYSKLRAVKGTNRWVSFDVTRVVGNKVMEAVFVMELLPEEDMPARYAHEAVGYQTVDYVDYASTNKDYKVELVCRWNLQPRDADKALALRGKLVEPAEPIVFYIAPLVPEEWRGHIERGILEWNRAFEAAGFRNAIQVRDLDEETNMADVKALVSYSVGYHNISSKVLHHPRTGEILGCQVNISQSFPTALLSRYLLQCGMTDKRVREDMLSKEVAGELLESMVASEVGKTLGLLENAAGSAAYSLEQIKDRDWVVKHGYTASIMDRNTYHFAAERGDKIPVEALRPHVGEYDAFAIRYGYKWLAMEDEAVYKKSLEKLAAEAEGNVAKRYLKMDATNPVAQYNDLGNDKLDVAMYGMKQLEEVYGRLYKITEKYDGEEWNMLMGLYGDGQYQYRYYLDMVAAYVGGRYTHKVSRKHPGPVATYPTKQDMAAVWAFLEAYAFTGGTDWLNTDMYIRNRAGQPYKLLDQWLETFFKRKLEYASMLNLLNANGAGGEIYYGAGDFFEDMNRILFHDFEETFVPSSVQKTMQLFYVNAMVQGVENYKEDDQQSDYKPYMLLQAKRLSEGLQSLEKNAADELTRLHYGQLGKTLRRQLKLD